MAHEIWCIEGDESTGFYLEGMSRTYGWFCIEVDTRAEVDKQLTDLGFEPATA